MGKKTNGNENIPKWSDRFKTEIEARQINLHGFKKLALMLDSWIEDNFLGVPVEEYFDFEFYLRNRRGRDAFAAGNKVWKLYDSLNDKNYWEKTDFKTNLWDNYGSLMKRDHVCVGNVDYDEFRAFTIRHPRFFAKLADRECGIGCKVLTCNSDSEAKEAYTLLHEANYVAEELVRQCAEFDEFNPSTLNTLRIVSFVDKRGEAQLIPYGVIRFGRVGKIADNFHGNAGICRAEFKKIVRNS